MEIKVLFEEPSRPWHALGCARLMCDIQHLCLFAMYLADEGVLDEFNVFEPYEQKYESMILADVAGRLDYYAVSLWSFNFNSPPEISFGIGHRYKTIQKFKEILDIFKGIIFFQAQARKQNAQADKQEADAELTWQKAFGKALENTDHGLKISARIKDPALRKRFEANLISALQPFADGRHPTLRNIDIPGLPPPDSKKS